MCYQQAFDTLRTVNRKAPKYTHRLLRFVFIRRIICWVICCFIVIESIAWMSSCKSMTDKGKVYLQQSATNATTRERWARFAIILLIIMIIKVFMSTEHTIVWYPTVGTLFIKWYRRLPPRSWCRLMHSDLSHVSVLIKLDTYLILSDQGM